MVISGCAQDSWSPALLPHHQPIRRMCTQFSSLQSLSPVQLFATSWAAACQVSLSINNALSLLDSCPLSQWCHPTISSCLKTSQILLLRRHCFMKVFLLVASKKAFCALAWLYLLTWHPPKVKPHFLSFFLKHLCVWLHQILVAAWRIPTNDGTQVSCTGRVESSPLDYQGSPQT